ncbi:MAG: cupin domain-containing protein [Balneolaceae bacterium]|nr:cupin domain-containing protein [Balneolaceae bacterium]
MESFSKVNLKHKFSLFDDQWSPKIVGELNGQFVKLAKVEGSFEWHAHDEEDELFMVIKGSLTIKLRQGDVTLGEGEFFIVPRGVEHKPVAEREAWILLFEPKETGHTGNIHTDRTVRVESQQWI